MKKIFTLLFAVGTISIASAQSKGFDHGKPDATYSFSGKQSAVQQINREYDYKIAAIKMTRRMNPWEKSKQIRSLENQRDREISQLQYRFEKNIHQNEDKRVVKNNTHRW